ncbi:MAG: hypothetical protein IT260_23880 [Saprospiraceae bacterium]|nr:hypothetical protein [Saprospiraceae bacterium]
MLHRYLFLLALWLPFFGHAQTDSLSSTAEKIIQARRELRAAFSIDNRQDVQYWLEILHQLEDADHLPTQWDERWLLYIWLENYTPLLEEAARFSVATEEENIYKVPPPADSLFELLDNRMYAMHEQLAKEIAGSFLSAEEKAFGQLVLELLLRLNTGDEAEAAYDARLTEFRTLYPTTRFARFIRKRMYNQAPPGDWGVGLDALFLHGTWSGEIERSLRPCFGADFALFFWKKRWNYLLRFSVGGQRLLSDVVQNGYVWPEEDPSTFFAVDLEAGYDLLNKSRFRLFPTLGVGFSSVHPPTPDEEEGPNPDYYEFFKFRGFHLTGALQADVKFKSPESEVRSSYQGVRVRLGYRYLNLDKENPYMKGNMFFFAVGFTLFGRQAQSE